MDGVCIDTELLLPPEEDDDQKLGWTKLGRSREERGGVFGKIRPKIRKSSLFSQKSFLFLFSKSILLFWKKYENSNFSGIFQSNHGSPLHIEAP
jgi:hypothetical protein